MRIRYPEFKETLKPFLCFSVHDIRKHYPDFDRKRLTEWQKKGYVQKVLKGYYLFTDIEKDTFLWWLIANRIFEPSYISLQSALNYYGFIPEGVFQVTSITTKRTRTLDTTKKRFIYRNIKKACYFGYTLLPFKKGHHIRLAKREKALLDLLYLDNTLEQEADFEAMRFNKPEIKKTVDPKLMEQYARLMNNRSLYNRFLDLKKWLYA